MDDAQLFIAEIVKEAVIAGRPGYCELGFVLIRAATLAEAEARAQAFSNRPPATYTNPDGASVTWRFVRVESVSPALSGQLDQVTELHAHIYRSLAAYEVAAAQRKLE